MKKQRNSKNSRPSLHFKRLVRHSSGMRHSQKTGKISDHSPLLTRPSIVPLIKSQFKPRPQWTKADWEDVRQKLGKKLGEMIAEGKGLQFREEIDLRDSEIALIIYQTTKQNIPITMPFWKNNCPGLVN